MKSPKPKGEKPKATGSREVLTRSANSGDEKRRPKTRPHPQGGKADAAAAEAVAACESLRRKGLPPAKIAAKLGLETLRLAVRPEALALLTKPEFLSLSV